MSGVVQMRPLVRLCQACGILPFRMELDAAGKQLQKFTFSYVHPLTVWFALLQLMPIIVNWTSLRGSRIRPLFFSDLPPPLCRTLQYVTALCYAGCLVVMFLLPLRYSHIRKAAQSIRQVEEKLKSSTDARLNVERRLFIAAAVALILVALTSSPVSICSSAVGSLRSHLFCLFVPMSVRVFTLFLLFLLNVTLLALGMHYYVQFNPLPGHISEYLFCLFVPMSVRIFTLFFYCCCSM